MRKVVPSFLTSMNLLAGFWALLADDPSTSFWLVCIGIGFDFVDGLSARLLKVPSLFGKELDSLADMVSFGVVPGYLYSHHVFFHQGPEFPAIPELLVCSLMPVCAGLRLAKFNVGQSKFKGFSGLPSSAAALMIISIPFLAHQANYGWLEQLLEENFWVKMGLPVVMSLLMVLPIEMFSFKHLKEGWKANWLQLAYLLMVIVLSIFGGFLMLPGSILLYILISVLLFVGRKIFQE